ncbi:MAG TPA: universal stress protein [Kofleriaceae bacterium]|nr:universal stress protein [Kofleriaceae bacterium]
MASQSRIGKIVVGTDFSDEATAALNAGFAWASRLGAELVLVNVLEEAIAGDDLTRERDASARRAMEQLAADIAGRGVPTTWFVVEGRPDTRLAEISDELGADLLVLGTHGRTGFRRLLLGSSAERTVRLARSGVMVARPGANERAAVERILVPTDFSEQANAGMELALQLAPEQAVIRLLHCWQEPALVGAEFAGGQTPAPLGEQQREAVLREGARLVQRYHTPGIDLGFLHRQQSATQGILTELEDEPYDLVVMASHGRTGVRRWLLGSVAEYTVRHAPCSVAVAPKPVESPSRDVW